MLKYIFGVAFWLCPLFLFSQHTLKITLVCGDEGHPLAGANVLVLNSTTGGSTNEEGVLILKNIPNGKQTLQFSYIGYETLKRDYTFPLNQAEIKVELHHEHEEMEEVIATSTRLSRDIAEIPTRIEAIAGEEVDEKINMRPNNVSMLLHESTGIQVQQNSYSSGVLSVRIQGLDGKYAQILKDGFASFGGFGGSMSLLDIPPLDLQQVEIIKGSASTLYGGGAISGMINFITKTPKENREVSVITNLTSIGGKNIGLFAAHQLGKIGYSLMTSYNQQEVYDVDKDGFSELPKGTEIGFSPKLFFNLNQDLKLILGFTYTKNDRIGGDVTALTRPTATHSYTEGNDAYRTIAQLDVLYKATRLKYSYSLFDRQMLKSGALNFNAQQKNHFVEIYTQKKKEKHTLVSGVNFILDDLQTYPITGTKQKVIGAYLQDNIDFNEKTALEAGLRTDYTFEDGFFALPRVSVLHKVSASTSLRLGSGLGYKLPTIYTEETEMLGFENLQNLGINIKAEESFGGTFDINYRGILGDEVTVAFNQLFFMTQITKPLVLVNRNGLNFLENQQKSIQTTGFESNLRLTIADFIKLFTGYTFTQAKNLQNGNFLALNPKHKLNFALIAEKHGNFKLGLEGYLTGKQYLENQQLTPTNVEFGLFAEKVFGKISIYLNAENFTDARQNKNQQMVFPPLQNPTFAPIYMHTEGRYINGGIKLKL